MRWKSSSRVALPLLAVVAALALAACGGGNDASQSETAAATTATNGGSDESIVIAAAAKATDAGSSKVNFTLTLQVPQQEAPLTMTGTGEFDYAAQTGKLSLDVAELLAASGVSGSSEPLEMILDGTTYYMKYPLLSAVLPSDKPWIRFDLEELAKQQGLDLSSLQQFNQSDPTATLNYLRASGTVEEVGPEEIDGVQTTHYTATIDLDKVAQQAPADVRDQVQATIDQLKEQAGVTELPIDVWIDGDGLPRRMQYEYSATVQGQDVTTVLEMDFTDYGVDVVVEPPPADQTADISELASLLGATTG